MIVEEPCLSTVLRIVTHPADGSFGAWALITLRVENREVASEAAGLDSMPR